MSAIIRANQSLKAPDKRAKQGDSLPNILLDPSIDFLHHWEQHYTDDTEEPQALRHRPQLRHHQDWNISEGRDGLK